MNYIIFVLLFSVISFAKWNCIDSSGTPHQLRDMCTKEVNKDCTRKPGATQTHTDCTVALPASTSTSTTTSTNITSSQLSSQSSSVQEAAAVNVIGGLVALGGENVESAQVLIRTSEDNLEKLEKLSDSKTGNFDLKELQTDQGKQLAETLEKNGGLKTDQVLDYLKNRSKERLESGGTPANLLRSLIESSPEETYKTNALKNIELVQWERATAADTKFEISSRLIAPGTASVQSPPSPPQFGTSNPNTEDPFKQKVIQSVAFDSDESEDRKQRELMELKGLILNAKEVTPAEPRSPQKSIFQQVTIVYRKYTPRMSRLPQK